MMALRPSYILLLLLAGAASALAQNMDSLYQDGRSKANSGNYLEAELIFSTILKLHPDDTAVLCRRGYVLKEMERYTAALADFNNVLIRYPSHTRSLNWRAEAYNSVGMYTLAIADMDALIELHDPNFDSLAYGDRGLYKQNKGDNEGAIKDYEKAISLAPNRALNYANLGELLCNIKRYEEGIAALSKAIQLAPDVEYNYVERGDQYAAAGNDSAAIPDYDVAYKLSATNANRCAYILSNRAMCKYRLNDYAGAIRDFNIISSVYGNYKELNYYRGLAKIALGNKTQGCADLKEAKNLKMKEAKEAIKKNCR